MLKYHNSISVEQLPAEVLQQIFILSSNHHFPLVSRTFYNAANCQTSIKTAWLLHKYEYRHVLAFHRGLRRRFFNKDILFQLDASYQSELKATGELPKPLPFLKRPIPQHLFRAPDQKYYELVKILLKRGGSPIAHNNYPIIKSAQLGCLDMVELLLQYDAKPDVKGNLALTFAVIGKNIKIVKRLIDAGAPVDDNCMKIAEKNNHPEMISLLKFYRRKL
ncbi:3840_t:CDS:1 [Paraglomus brasilianum]|uniref:3840_t:CDS:1 n=1 Tax=Paraglomus brasilianum TaxID=144538 RepID=A0A9N8ZFD3_9GLOM|nr:3840_t:CDS:1 [Paraglomus brasilianum]